MPRTRSLAWAELKIGVLMVAGVVITVVAIFLLTGGKGFFWQRYHLKAQFTNVAGLNPGSPVRLAGVEVGEVTGVELSGELVDVTFQVNDAYQRQITTASTAKLGSVSLLGESAVDITPASAGTPIPEWGYVPQGRAAQQLSDITDAAGQGITELSALIHDVRTGRGTVGKLMTDEQLYVELNRFVASAGALTDGLKQGKGTLGKLATDPTTVNSLNATLENIEEVTRALNAGGGSLGKLLKDDAFATSLNATTSNINTLVSKINSGQGTAGKFISDPVVFDQLESVTAKLDQLMTSLNAGDGTAGRLLKDRQLYENMNGAVNDVRSLVDAIKKDPRRYLNIRVSIF